MVDKPHHMLSVPGKGEEKQDSLLHRILKIYPNALLVHRLDWETSGLVIFALTAHSQRALNLQFEKRQVEKEYVAVIKESVENSKSQSGAVSLPLRPDLDDRPRQVVDEANGKPAVTRWEFLEQLEPDGHLVRLKPETCRTHQLRVHMQARGTPILGDSLYAEQTEREAAERLLLHADSITVNCPTGLSRLRFWSLSRLGRGGSAKRG